ncbi:hypothetical protein B0H12DRAFT_1071741 [Mycena haematopus]|nr:hypothetical protein B0H12DRAFT_1071741 [Mycena haematopus]
MRVEGGRRMSVQCVRRGEVRGTSYREVKFVSQGEVSIRRRRTPPTSPKPTNERTHAYPTHPRPPNPIHFRSVFGFFDPDPRKGGDGDGHNDIPSLPSSLILPALIVHRRASACRPTPHPPPSLQLYHHRPPPPASLTPDARRGSRVRVCIWLACGVCGWLADDRSFGVGRDVDSGKDDADNDEEGNNDDSSGNIGDNDEGKDESSGEIGDIAIPIDIDMGVIGVIGVIGVGGVDDANDREVAKEDRDEDEDEAREENDDAETADTAETGEIGESSLSAVDDDAAEPTPKHISLGLGTAQKEEQEQGRIFSQNKTL